MNKKSKSSVDISSKSAGKNASKRLYNLGLVSHYRKQTQVQHAIQVKQDIEMVEAKFTPHINQISQTIDPLITAASTVLILGTLAVMLLLDRLVGLDRVLIGEKQ